MRRADAKESPDHDGRPIGNQGDRGFQREYGFHHVPGVEGPHREINHRSRTLYRHVAIESSRRSCSR